MAFMGFWAVIKNAGKVLNNINDCKKALAGFQPDVLILVDYPGFNLRMALFCEKTTCHSGLLLYFAQTVGVERISHQRYQALRG